MENLFVIVLFVFIGLLVLIMFLFLRNIILKINQQSKDYFVDKLQVYDELINEKEERLKGLNDKIKNCENIITDTKEEDRVQEKSSNYLFNNIRTIDYQDDNIFLKMKDIDERFKFDSSKVVKKFVKENFDDSNLNYYASLKEIKDVLTKEKVYFLVSKRSKEQEKAVREIFKGDLVKILDDFTKKNSEFDILKFMTYFNKIIDKNDPFVYVYVGNKEENYDSIHSFVRTKVDSSIYKGITIVYRGKLYDFSLK